MAVDIESHLNELRVFEPSREFAQRARVRSIKDYEALRREALADPEKFWCERARAIDWMKPWTTWFEKDSPFVRFFVVASST
jgi:acetyl-CoA synthetase